MGRGRREGRRREEVRMLLSEAKELDAYFTIARSEFCVGDKKLTSISITCLDDFHISSSTSKLISSCAHVCSIVHTCLECD